MTKPPSLRLFTGFGVELEYMIIDRETFSVRPICDEIMKAVAGNYVSEFDRNGFSWSNELVLHVVELKTNGPAPRLEGLADGFHKEVRAVLDILDPMNAGLLPGAVHPWFDPMTETQLWPHEYSPVYEAFNRIFGCEGHGWSNLQSTHLNLPFADDAEFGRLHAAIRLVLPILPALAASSPVLEGKLSGRLDTRLHYYRNHTRKVPSVIGRVIPEQVFTIADYAEQLLARMYKDVAPHDPDRIVQYEWLNARGAIARFMRNTIEVRVLDIQECPRADLAVLELSVAALRALVEERWGSYDAQKEVTVDALEPILIAAIDNADEAVIEDSAYLRLFGLEGRDRATAGELWRHLAEALVPREHEARRPLESILEHGPLARRMLRALVGDPAPDRPKLKQLFARLAGCLEANEMFVP